MAVLPPKLVERLNNQYELGEFKFGKELQKCLTEISNNPGSGACITVPSYTSNAAAEAACGKIPGNMYFNIVTENIVYCDDSGNWVEIDYTDKCEQVDINTTKITLNMDNITMLLNSITSLQTDFANHNHDGVNSSPIDIKNLITTAPAGNYFFSTGSGIDCGPVPTTIQVEEGGAIVNATVDSINFTPACFDITSTGGTSILVDIPDLPSLKSSVAMNTMSISNNTTAISNLSTQVVNIQTTLTAKCEDVDNLQATMASHCHDGVDSAQIIVDKIVSQQTAGTNLPIDTVICANGTGGWQYVTKASLSGSAVTVVNVGPGEDLVAATSTTSNYDIKGILPGCGIAVTSTATDVEVALDFAGMANVGTAIDITQDTILVHDASTGECVQTSLQSIMSAISGKEYFAGKGITRTTEANGDCTFDLDLTTITANGTNVIDCDNDYVVFYDASEAECKSVPFSEIPSDNVCCLPDPGGLSLLDSVFISSTGIVTPSNIGNPLEVGQFIVVGFKPGQVCIQDFGPVDIGVHGLNVGDCYFEAVGGPTTTPPTVGINNVLYHVISSTKITVVSGTRPYEIASPASFDVDDLEDVVITNPQEGDKLCYDSASGTWINQPI